MKNEIKQAPAIFNSISELHRAMGLPKPLHPLVSLVNNSAINRNRDEMITS